MLRQLESSGQALLLDHQLAWGLEDMRPGSGESLTIYVYVTR